MNCYRYRLNNATFDVFATNRSKAKHFLQSVVGYGTPTFIAKVTDFTHNVENVIAVNVPTDYLTPKQTVLQLIKDEYKRGDIDFTTYEKDIKAIKENWK
jgi:hypothetical protein